MRQKAPSTATTYDVEDGVEDAAQSVEARTSGRLGSGKMGFEAAPLGVRAVAPVCFSHARHPTERAPQNPFSDSFMAKFGESPLRSWVNRP